MKNPFEQYINELPAIDDTWSHPTCRSYFGWWRFNERAAEEARKQIERLFQDAIDEMMRGEGGNE